MNYHYQKPNPLLTDLVRTVLVLDGSSKAEPSELPLFTNGMPALFCKTGKDPSGHEQVLQLSLFGRSAPADSWEVNEQDTIIAYFFKPFTLACLFNLSATKLAAGPVELSTWNAHSSNALRTQLAYADTLARKIEILDNLLLQQLKQQQKDCAMIRYVTDEILRDPAPNVLSDILQKLQLNERTFQRSFKKFVGISPNQYRRLCQFQDSFTQLRTDQYDKLTDIAYDNGFSDQSHFIRSFKEFTNTTPKDYLRSGLKKKDS